MLSSHNLLKPATGEPIVAPSQDIVWGTYYMTFEDKVYADKKDNDLKHFYDSDEARLAYDNGFIDLHEPIIVKVNGERVRTTVGRLIFNLILPEKLRFINEVVGKGKIKDLIKECLRLYSEEETVHFIDNLKNRSFALLLSLAYLGVW